MTSTNRLDAYHFYEEEWDSYEQLREAFEWEVPDQFNIAAYVCDRWAEDRGRTAVFAETPDGEESVYTFWRLQNEANRLANFLEDSGVERGDRVGVNLNQRPETLVAHIACWKLGAVSVPLSLLFGPEAIEHRLGDCDAVACVVEDTNINALRTAGLPALETVLTVGDVDHRENERDLYAAIADYSREFETADTDAEDDAVIIYTSGTTGPPKGVLHAHRFLLGHLPVVAEGFLETGWTEDRVAWTPVEWSWIGSLFSVVVPTLYYGQPIIAYASGQFDPEEAFRIMEKYGTTTFSGPPTALRMMMQVKDVDRWNFSEVQNVGAGGESVGESIREWAAETFGVDDVEEGYGQTEANLTIADCAALAEVRQGKMGLAGPGHEVTILDEQTREELGPGEVGEIAVRYEGDPVCLKGYWDRPEKTAGKVRDGWLLTEDLGRMDEDGFFEFVGRTDDVIISSGYKIGPEEIEETLAGHEAVADAGVIGVSHDERGQVPKAFVVLVDGDRQSDDLRTALQDYVQDRLAAYEYPRELEFIDELPRTSTEKVRRRDLREREGLL